MRILLVHAFGGRPPFGLDWMDGWLRRVSTAGVQVDGFYAGLGQADPRLSFASLDRLWRRGDRTLLDLYERLANAATGYDALINYGAVNLHPRFLESLKLITVLGFFDDPESSDDCSRPVAPHHDLCMVGNIAELNTYRSWGVSNVEWWPMGFRANDFDPRLTRERILLGERAVDVVLLCERLTHWRRQKVDRFAASFPQGVYRGPGWPGGFLPEDERVPLLSRSKIGINIHNSTGPINFRTFYLPANGVLQICDNRSHLAEIYDLGREVVGFDSMEEAIELCHYYLQHDDERRAIAAAGWERAVRDYNEHTAFAHVVRAIERLQPLTRQPIPISLERYHEDTRTVRVRESLAWPATWPVRHARRFGRGLYRRYLRFRDNVRLRVTLRFVARSRGRGE